MNDLITYTYKLYLRNSEIKVREPEYNMRLK